MNGDEKPLIIGTPENPVLYGISANDGARARAYWEGVEAERRMPDVGPRYVTERVRPHVVEIGDQLWSIQEWHTITEIREAGDGPHEVMEPQRHFKWFGNDNWHCFGEWTMRLVEIRS